MKINLLLSTFAIACIANALLIANCYLDDKPCGWLSGTQVHVDKDGVYIDTNKGKIKMNVIEYDYENNRYLVECIFEGGEFPYPQPIIPMDRDI